MALNPSGETVFGARAYRQQPGQERTCSWQDRSQKPPLRAWLGSQRAESPRVSQPHFPLKQETENDWGGHRPKGARGELQPLNQMAVPPSMLQTYWMFIHEQGPWGQSGENASYQGTIRDSTRRPSQGPSYPAKDAMGLIFLKHSIRSFLFPLILSSQLT